MTELKSRGIQDILVACVDGLKGFPEAIASVYPHTDIQLCIVHVSKQPAICQLERLQSSYNWLEINLSGKRRRQCLIGTGCILRAMEPPISENRRNLEGELGKHTHYL